MDVRGHTTTSDGRLDEDVELLVTADSELEVTGGDTLHLGLLGGVAGKLEDLSGEVLKDGSRVHGGRGTDTAVSGGAALEEAVDTADRELKTGARGARLGVLLVASLLVRLGRALGSEGARDVDGGGQEGGERDVPCW